MPHSRSACNRAFIRHTGSPCCSPGLLALAGYGIYRLRLQQVEAQFNAVLAERNRIAREIHDTLAQGFVAVSLQLELASRKLEQSPDVAKKLSCRLEKW